MFKSKNNLLLRNVLIMFICTSIVSSKYSKKWTWQYKAWLDKQTTPSASEEMSKNQKEPNSTLIPVEQYLEPVNCWNCSTSVPARTLFCPVCKTIQKPNKKQDYYDLLGVNQSFLIDSGDMALGLKNLQKKLHPDKFTLKSKKERDISNSYSSFINKAYGTLENPYERGAYLLSLHNITITDDTKMDQQLLIRMFDINEQLDQAKTPEDMEKIWKPIREELHDLYYDTFISFENNDFKKATEQMIRIKFLMNLDKQIDERKYDLENKLYGPVEVYDPAKHETEPPTTTRRTTTTIRSKWRRKNNPNRTKKRWY